MSDTLLFVHEAMRNAGLIAFAWVFITFLTGGVCGMTRVEEDEPEPVGQGTAQWEA